MFDTRELGATASSSAAHIVLTLEPLYESLTLLSEALVSNVLIIYQKSWKPHIQFRFKIKQFVFRKTPNLAYFLSQYHIHRSDQDTFANAS